MKNKKVWIGLGVLFLVMALMAGVWFAARPAPREGMKAFSVTVVHKDGRENAFEYETQEEYLGTALLTEGLIEGSQGPYGLMIQAVDGEKADWNTDHSYWALYIGSDYATTGIDATPITDGGAYRLVYTLG